MKKIINYLRIKKWRTLQIIILLFIVSLLQVGTSYIQVFSFNRLVKFDFIGFLKIELINLFLWIILLLLSYLTKMKKEKLVTSLSLIMRERYSSLIANQSYVDYKSKKPDEYASTINNDIELIEMNGFKSFFALVETIFVMVFSLIALTLFHYSLFIVTIVFTVILTFIPNLFANKSQRAMERKLDADKSFLTKNLDILEGFNVLFSANKMGLIPRRIRKNSLELQDEKIRYTKVSGGISTIINFISISSQMLLSIYTGFLVYKGFVTLGVVGSVGSIAGNVFNSLTVISSYLIQIKSIENIFKKIPSGNVSVKEATNTSKFLDLDINNLSLKYNEEYIFKDLSLHIKKGGKYVIVGESGSGKTRLFKRVQNYEGSIYLNHKDIRNYVDRDIYNIISYGGQDKYIFDTSLKNNLTLWSSVSDEEVSKVVELCNIKYLNLESPVSSSVLSEGEKQRIVLARTLILNKDIIFIDEGTANLDKDNAKVIEKMLLTLKDKTVVMISHNLFEENTKYIDKIIDISKYNV